MSEQRHNHPCARVVMSVYVTLDLCCFCPSGYMTSSVWITVALLFVTHSIDATKLTKRPQPTEIGTSVNMCGTTYMFYMHDAHWLREG